MCIRDSVWGVYQFLKIYKQIGLVRKPGSGAAPKVTDEIVEDQMETGDETTAIELQQPLKMQCIIFSSYIYSLLEI